MKVITASELALLCIVVHYQEGIKSSVNKCGLFSKFSSVAKNLCFQHGNQSYFLLSFFCLLLCDSSLLIMDAKNKKSLFSYFEKVKNFLLDFTLFLLTKGFQTHLRICVSANVCVLERTHESRLCVQRTYLHGLPGQRYFGVREANGKMRKSSFFHRLWQELLFSLFCSNSR